MFLYARPQRQPLAPHSLFPLGDSSFHWFNSGSEFFRGYSHFAMIVRPIPTKCDDFSVQIDSAL